MTAIATIAIVDDDDSVRQSLRQLLRAADFQALTFASAEEYLTHGDGARVDCLIVDVNLPGMSGVALVQALTANGSKTPAILITARDDSATLDLIRRAGPIPHLRKPFNDEQLFAAISRVLPSE
jgi:FixJ family two-component response regulator